MIVPMKKTYILTLKSSQEDTLKILRDLEVLHINILGGKVEDTQDRTENHNLVNSVERLSNILSQKKAEPMINSQDNGKEVFERANWLLEKSDALNVELESYRKLSQELSPWGNFNFADIEKLKEQNVFIKFCVAKEKELLKLSKDFTCEEISRSKGNIYFLVISNEKDFKGVKLPVVNISQIDKNYGEVVTKINKIQREIVEVNEQLVECASKLQAIEKYLKELKEKDEFLIARDSMASDEEIVYIEGFIPATEFPKIVDAAKKHGWAYFAEDADKNDTNVPTLLKMPKWATIIKPLFSFLGISPGYNEIDVASPVTIFFTIFFGILVGDAGYGLVFLLFSGLLWLKNRNKPAGEPFKLISILSLSAIVWGILTSNYFGLSIPNIPILSGVPAIANDPNKDKYVTLICFALGVLQLMLGHLWRLCIDLRVRNIIGQIGWLVIYVGTFMLISGMLVFPEFLNPTIKYFYGIGILLVGLGDIDWTDVSSIFGFPFSIINSFVDLLSYIRLFAVGVAGYSLSVSFNSMATPLLENGGAGIFTGTLILVCGHLLTIALAVLSVLVHGVRLNTLEFSSHIGLQWSGISFKPFAKEK